MCRPGRRPVVDTRMRLPASRASRSRPSTLSTIEAGIDAGAGVRRADRDRRAGPTVRDGSSSFGGVVSPIQNRNVNAPGSASAGVSKTTSYVPAAGHDRPRHGHALAEDPEVGVEVERQRRVAGEAVLVTCSHRAGLDARRSARSTARRRRSSRRAASAGCGRRARDRRDRSGSPGGPGSPDSGSGRRASSRPACCRDRRLDATAASSSRSRAPGRRRRNQ